MSTQIYCDANPSKCAGEYVWYVSLQSAEGRTGTSQWMHLQPSGQPLGEPHHWLICGMQIDDVAVPGHILIRMMWKWVGCSLSFSFKCKLITELNAMTILFDLRSRKCFLVWFVIRNERCIFMSLIFHFNLAALYHCKCCSIGTKVQAQLTYLHNQC